jgi:hypothetical protein
MIRGNTAQRSRSGMARQPPMVWMLRSLLHVLGWSRADRKRQRQWDSISGAL